MKKNKIITTGMRTMRYYLQSFIVVLLLVCYSNVSKSQNGVNAFTVNDPCTNCVGTAQNALYSFPVVLSFNWTNSTTSATVTLGYDNTKVSYDNFNLSSLPSCISVNYATPGVLTVKMLNLSSCPSPTGAISFQVYFRFICRDSCANDIKTAYFKGTLTDNFNNTLTSNCSIDGKYISNWIFNHAWYSYNASTAEITYKVDYTNQSCVIVKNPKFNVTLSPCSGTITRAWGTEDSNNDGIPDYTYTVSGGTTITPNSTAYMLYAHDVMYYVVKLNCGTCINQTLICNIKLMGDNCNIPNSTIVIAAPPVSFLIPSPAANPSASLVKSVSTSPSPHFVSVITNTGNTALNLIMDDFLPLVHAFSVIQRSNQIGLNNTANYYDCSGTIGSPNILITASGNNGTPALTNLPVNTKKIKYSINNLLPNSWVKLEVYFDLTSSCSAGTPPYKDSCSVNYNCTAPAVTCMPCGTGTGTKTGVVVYNPQPILSCISHSNYNSSCKKVGDTLNFCFTFKNTGDAPMPAGGIFYAPMPNWLQRIPNSETFTGFTSNPTYLSGNAKWTLPAIAIGSTVSLCFNAVINAGATGQAIVTPTVSVGNKNYDIIGSGDCQIIINICAFAAIGIDKKVMGSLDSSYGASGSGVAGSLVNYEITLHNAGSGAVDHLEVIDRIPSSGDLTILGNPNSTSRGSQFNLLMGSPPPIIPNCTVSYSSVPNACTGWSGVGLNCGLPLVPTWSPTPGGAKNIHFLFNPSVTMAPGDIKTFNFQLQIPAGTPTGLLACNSAGFIAKPVNAAFTINPVESPIVCVEVKSGGVQPQQGCCHDVMKKIQANQNVENNTLVVNANMSVGPAKIKSASVSLVDFHVTHPKDCDVCVKDPKLMGNIVNPSGAGNWSYVPQGVSYSHSIEWKDNIGKDWSSGIPLHFEIPLPPKNPDSNCCDTISYCLKYSFTDTACITCDTIICYQVINGNCGGGGSTGCSCNFKPVFNYSLDGYRIGRDGHKYVIHGVTKSSNVTCGDVLNLSAGSFSTNVTPNFECKDKSGKSCRGAVLNVTIKKPDNTVQILAGTSYSFSFASPGTYQYTISTVCDGKPCECTFKVVIGGESASCKCNKWSSEPVKYQSTETPTSPARQGTVNCNDSITLPLGSYTFTAPDYICSSGSCLSYDWVFRTPNNFQAAQRGINALPLDFTNHYYGGPGTYKVYIYAKCGSKDCGTCSFKVVVVNKIETTGNGPTKKNDNENLDCR